MKAKKTSAEIFQIPFFVPWLAVGLNITAVAFLPIRNVIPTLVFISASLLISWVTMRNLK